MSESAASRLWVQRPLIGQLVRRNIRRRYRGHVLGPLWPFLNPLALLAIYTLVFSVFIGIPRGVNADWDTGPGWMGHLRFAAIAYAGLVAFTFFTDVLASSSQLVRNEPNFVKKTVFPLEVLAPVHVASLLLDLAVGVVFLLVLSCAVGNAPDWHVALLPLALLPLLLFALAAAWTLSAVATYIPDVAEFVGMFLRVYFFLTPVVYPLELVPMPYRIALYVNPLASILNGIRNVTLFHRGLVWESWLLITLVGLLASIAALGLFRRLRPGFADVI
jgi:lipopolysaccharide transport system permease protein